MRVRAWQRVPEFSREVCVMSRLFFGALVLGSLVTFGAARADEEVEDFAVETTSPVNPNRNAPRDDSWYYHPSSEAPAYKPNPSQIIQQKAMARGQQRNDRLASSAWYGMYNGRPNTASTPFCSPLYSPTWQSPYRNGLSWRPSTPVYIVTGRPSYSVR
jgi:hypothetical protein